MQRADFADTFRARGFVTILMALAPLASAFAQLTTGNLPPGVVASQGGVQVSLQDIDAYAAKIPEKDRAGFFDSPKRIEGVIMNLLLQRQLATEARAEKLDKDPAVQRQIEQATDDTLARVDLEQFRKNLKLPDFDQLAQEYYLTHKSEFVVPGDVTVKHVLVSMKDRAPEEAKARIAEVETAAKAHPDQFDALVEKYSDDPSKVDNHGLIKDAASSKMAVPFAKAAAELKTPGELSPIVKTSFGFHVLQFVDRKPDTPQTFEDARPVLVAKMRNEWIERQVNEHSGKMRGNPLDANPELVASLRERYLPPGMLTPQAAQAAADEAAAAAKKASSKKEETRH